MLAWDAAERQKKREEGEALEMVQVKGRKGRKRPPLTGETYKKPPAGKFPRPDPEREQGALLTRIPKNPINSV
jgi:hypothetical protein